MPKGPEGAGSFGTASAGCVLCPKAAQPQAMRLIMDAYEMNRNFIPISHAHGFEIVVRLNTTPATRLTPIFLAPTALPRCQAIGRSETRTSKQEQRLTYRITVAELKYPKPRPPDSWKCAALPKAHENP